MNTAETTTVRCHSCFGKGYLPHLRHVDDGICYTCSGEGVIEVSKAPRSKVATRPATAPIETLRAMYRAAASREGEARIDWIVSFAEPFDAYSDRSPLTVARAALAALDAGEAAKVRAAFRNLGISF